MINFTYKNKGNRMIVLRCVGPSEFFIERVLYPTSKTSNPFAITQATDGSYSFDTQLSNHKDDLCFH